MTKDGKELRGLSQNQFCIGIACDKEYTYAKIEGMGKTSTGRTLTTYDILDNITSITKGSKTIVYGYTGKLLTSITVDGLVYSFEYNEYKDITTIKIAGETVLSNTYKDLYNSKYSGQIDSTTYGSNTISFIYDEEKRIKETFVNGIKQIDYSYDSLGNIAKIIDFKTNITYHYNYDHQNRLVTINSSDGNNIVYEYNSDGYFNSKTNINGEIGYVYSPISTTEGTGKSNNQVLTSENFNNGLLYKQYNYLKDINNSLIKLDNISFTTSSFSIVSTYSQDNFQKTFDGVNRNYETMRIKELHIKKVANNVTTNLFDFYYTYDVYDNIKTINRYDNGILSVYEYFEYDIHQQLTYHLQEFNGDITYYTFYSYDNRGNITYILKENNGFENNFSYISYTYHTSGWKDLLTSVDINGTIYYITGYDSTGNPANYLQYTDGLTYDNRRITGFHTPYNSYTYTYNASGIRTSKKLNSSNFTTYVLEGSKILKETRNGVDLRYYYDSEGIIVGFYYNGNTYLYIKNLQNDIIAISDLSGNILVKYYYDAYGNIIKINDNSEINLGTINPFRYKSYYYDEETKFYYLNSRFYDPLIGRFINADDISMLSMGETNLFSYCGNNPIIRNDKNGYSWISKRTEDLKEIGKSVYSSGKNIFKKIGKGIVIGIEYFFQSQYEASMVEVELTEKKKDIMKDIGNATKDGFIYCMELQGEDARQRSNIIQSQVDEMGETFSSPEEFAETCNIVAGALAATGTFLLLVPVPGARALAGGYYIAAGVIATIGNGVKSFFDEIAEER